MPKKIKIPKGHWIIIGYSKAAIERCTEEPKVMIHMFGNRQGSTEIFSEEMLDEFRGKVPIVQDFIHPCTNEVKSMTRFGLFNFERKFI